MSDEHHRNRTQVADGCSRHGEHLDPAILHDPSPQIDAADHGSTPPWPVTMIEPSESELARWTQLWTHPQAAVWAQTEQEHTVATLIRLERRCSGRCPPTWTMVVELKRLRLDLGLGS
jgi:hypothetical protein